MKFSWFSWCFMLLTSATFAGCPDPREMGKCPDGFRAVDGLCLQALADAGTGGTGGTIPPVPVSDTAVELLIASGPDAADTADTADVADTAPPEAPPPPSPSRCVDPRFPLDCPALNDADATCAEATADCGTLTRCPDKKKYVCQKGYAVSCQYPNKCTPIDQSCQDPRWPKFCSAAGGAGPGCWSADTDCSTLTACGNEVVACKAGNYVNCQREPKCAPLEGACTNPTHPQFCPAKGGVAPSCWSSNTDCSTVAACGNKSHGCQTGYHVNCAYPFNPCGPNDDKCPDPEFPRFCPATGSLGPGCYREGSDCQTATLCNSQPLVCLTGYKPNCRYTANPCSPAPATCTDRGYKYCPANGLAGPSCWYEYTDCSTVTVCDGQLKGCQAGQKYDCAAKRCVPL